MFNQIKDIAAVKADLVTVQGNENNTRKLLNKRVPEIVEGVLAGDNISIANQVVRSVVGGRKQEMFLFLKAMLPFEFDSEKRKFLKKTKDAKQIEIKEANFKAFKDSGQTVFGWIDANVKTEKKEPDYLARVEKAVKSALKHEKGQKEVARAILEGGLDVDMLIAVLDEVVQDDDVQAA